LDQQKIFISYSRVDGQQFAVELSARLRKAGADVWLDQVDIEPGKIWDFEIEKALQRAEAVIFIATEKSTSSNNVLNEVYYALEENKEVIPVIFHDCKMPFRLKRLQYINFTSDYETALDRLLKSLRLQKDDSAPVTEEIVDPVKTTLPEKKISPEPRPPVMPPEIKKQPEPIQRDEPVNFVPTQRPVYPPVQRLPERKTSNTTVYWILGGVVVLLLALAGLYGSGSSADTKSAYIPPVQTSPDTSSTTDEPTEKKATPLNKTRATSNWKTFTQSNYSIQYPPNWDLNPNPGLGLNFAVLSRLENGNDLFRENVALMIQNLAGRNIDLDKFATISEEQVRTVAVNGVLLESSRMEDGQYPHQHLVYTSDQNNYHLTTEQYYWVQGQQAYILTLSCEQDKYDAYKRVGEQILNSFYFH
jgi:hypothetical protein